MRLGSGFRSVELKPVGYQFPQKEPNGPHWDWDANWLMIRGDIADGSLEWAFEDPCMTTREARELSQWLRVISTGGTPTTHLSFTEPNIEFRFLEGTQEEAGISVGFAQESAPPGSDGEVRFGEGHPVKLTLWREAFGAAADEWDFDLAAFPER